MLRAVEDGVSVVVCTTCRYSAEALDDDEGRRGGVRLAGALKAMQAGDPAYVAVAVQEMPCLFACQEFCTIHLRAPEKVGYVLGRFAPGEDAARAILDYARLYGESTFGQVPFKQWPEGVKGHFITRTPPAGFVVE